MFLGYAIQPSVVSRNEYHVASVKDLMEKKINETVQVVRVNQLTVPDGPLTFPLKARYKVMREELSDSLDFGSTPDLKKMDAETIDDLVAGRKPAPKEIDDGEDDLDELLREAGLDGDEDIEVINPKTGSKEYIAKDDPSYHDSSGFKGRSYRVPPNPKAFLLFFGREPPKRLESVLNMKLC